MDFWTYPTPYSELQDKLPQCGHFSDGFDSPNPGPY